MPYKYARHEGSVANEKHFRLSVNGSDSHTTRCGWPSYNSMVALSDRLSLSVKCHFCSSQRTLYAQSRPKRQKPSDIIYPISSCTLMKIEKETGENRAKSVRNVWWQFDINGHHSNQMQTRPCLLSFCGKFGEWACECGVIGDGIELIYTFYFGECFFIMSMSVHL